MITREALKNNAKNVLSKHYWMGFAACLVVSAITGAASGISSGVNMLSGVARIGLGATYDPHNISSVIPFLGLSIIGMIIFYSVIIAMAFFVMNPLTAGLTRFFSLLRKDRDELTEVFYAFKQVRYMNVVKTMAAESVFIWLWSLLFVIPGIIKTLEYFMVPYIIAENPDIEWRRAFDITKKTMDGEKSFLFVLHLSFIGWILLSFLTCVFGAIYMTPYISATMAEYYAYLRTKAITLGIATVEDLPGYPEAA